MNIYAFAPIAWALDLGYTFLQWLSSLLAPLTGELSAGLAVIVLTLAVRTLLIPVGRSQVRGELGRARIAPQLADLQRRYAKRPQELSEKTLELYRSEGVSMFAGIGPAILQAPVLITVYGLFVLTSIGGHANALLDASLAGVPLGQSLVHLLSTGPVFPGVIIYGVMLAVIVAVAEYNRRRMIRLSRSASATTGSLATMTRIMPWLSYVSAVTAIFVPLAAGLYLATTTLWTAIERAVLHRRLSLRSVPHVKILAK
ncbi:YidC/Oxa1 family membrane protein insertase [Psychromicrobium xiongbiense]|uniref:YidC/Oxa1 family membrane protein insertase n=1 Tax=Psychromicrobium xiongbiense TaxID=3051184 RepID=UPI002553CEF8|nr:membrane protein insertase YidC [Psychromicrobium sp. YIM S02556]